MSETSPFRPPAKLPEEIKENASLYELADVKHLSARIMACAFFVVGGKSESMDSWETALVFGGSIVVLETGNLCRNKLKDILKNNKQISEL